MATPFNVVKGTEQAIKSCDPIKGYLWFALDTRKIYYSDGSDFISMGGNSSVFYGTLTWPEDNLPDTDQIDFDFTMDDIEGDATPNVDDLILNSDGCFYRVMAVSGTGLAAIVSTTKLTIAGSGGGSGGGGGITPTTSIITIITDVSAKYFLETETHPTFTFNVHSTVESNNKITKITYKIGTKEFFDYEPHNFGDITVDLSPYFNMISESGTSFSFSVEDTYGAKKTSSNYTLRKVKLILIADSSNENEILQATNKLLQYKAVPTGSSSISNVKICYNIYTEGATSPIATFEKPITNMTGSYVSQDLRFDEIDTINDGLGAYSLEVYCQGIAGGQTVVSNVLTHSIISYGVNPILVAYIPGHQTGETFYVDQYDDIDLSYEIAKSVEDNQKARITFTIDGEETIQEVEFNEIYKFNIYFETAGYHTVVIADIYGHTQSFNNIYARPFDGSVQVIDNSDMDLMLNLTARGRNNNEISSIRSTWADKTRTGIATLSDFVWGNVNGWITDDENVNMLRLSSGANMVVNGYEPFALNANNKEGMETGKSIELDFRISDVTDYSAPLITCLSLDANDNILCGFNITGEAATFNTHNIKVTGATITEGEEEDQVYNTQIQGLTAKFAEGERIHLTWVIQKKTERYPMIKTYINGIVSGITEYTGGSSGDSIAQNPTANAEPALIKIGSNTGTVDVYNIRVFDKVLSDRQVLENYIATLPTAAEKVATYNSNIGLLDSNGKISINNIESGNYNITLPYIKFTGGAQCTKDDAGYHVVPNGGDGSNHLPRGKKDFRLINHFDFVYPTDTNRNVDLISEVNDEGLVNGVVIYGQGTSSMEYPIKNLRVKFKMKKNGKKVKFQVNPDDYPVDILTLKADYMESSSSHNTGTANLVFNALEALRLHTPGQNYWNAQNPEYKTLTAIRGYPIICFYREDEDHDFEFIGRYNLNMDKSSENAFGFLPVPEKEEEITSVDDIEFGWIPNDAINTNLDPVEHPYINAIRCYEFLNNASNLDNFICPDKYRKAYRDTNKEDKEKLDFFDVNETYYIKDGDNYIEVLEPIEDDFKNYYIKQNFEKLFYQNEYDESGEVVPNWFTSFEARYPEDSEDIEAFYQMCAWLNSTSVDEATNEALDQPVVYGNITYTIDNGDYRLSKFKNELDQHFNVDFLLFYYILTHVLLMIDSRAKNMMMATWGPESGHGPHSIWYPIFYDMDTMLGLNNYGYNKFDYNVEDKDVNVFNGQASVLWNNLRAKFESEIRSMYGRMQTSGGLNYNDLLRNYNTVQADMWNEIMYNYDATYKYIDPYANGYYDGLNKRDIEPGTKNYLYAAQGSRSMHRRYWLKNRIAYFNGKYLSQAYTSDKFMMRIYTPDANADNYYRVEGVTAENFGEQTYYIKPDENQAIFEEAINFEPNTIYYAKADNRLGNSLAAVPPNNNYYLTPLHNQYLAVGFGGSNGQTAGPTYATANVETIMEAPKGAKYNDTETYVYGGSQIKDLGDLSPQYLGLFMFPETTTRLENLVLGNMDNDYFNPNFSSLNIGTAAPQLKNINIANTQLTGALDLSHCQKIETIEACGSKITSVSLPSYGVLRKLRLPNTITSLVLDNQKNLTNENFTIGTYDSVSEEYTMTTNSTLLTISIEGMPQFDSYQLLKTNCESLLYYCLRDIYWNVDASEIVDTDDGKGIYAIERILARNVVPQRKGSATSHARALTGTIRFTNITDPSDTIAVYNHYANIYPDLSFEFDENSIKHINLYNGDGVLYWSKPIAVNGILSDEFFNSSSYGPFVIPLKTSNTAYVYEFENAWTYTDSNNEIQTINGQKPIINDQITTDIDFYPVFTESTRTYTVIYHINNEVITNAYDYNTPLIDTLPKVVPYSSNNSPLSNVNTSVYPFLGYSTRNATATDDLFDFYSANALLNTNKEFYAVFGNELIDVHNNINVFYPAWEFSPGNYSENLELPLNYNSIADTSFNIMDGYIIRPKSGWSFTNFVTIPNQGQDSKPVYGINSQAFKNQNITRVYFENYGNNLRILQDSAFASCGNLVYFEFPENLRIIKQQALQLTSLENLTNLNNNLVFIGHLSFNQIRYSGNLIIIPSSVKAIEGFAFSNFDFVTSCSLQIGISNNEPSVLDLNHCAYRNNDNYLPIFNNQLDDVVFYSTIYHSPSDVLNLGQYDSYNPVTEEIEQIPVNVKKRLLNDVNPRNTFSIIYTG